MSLQDYGVLKGRPIASRLGAGSSPHYQIHVIDDQTDYRIAINVKSKIFPSSLLYVVVEDFQHPVIGSLEGLAQGFHHLDSRPGGAALDFIRGNLFDRAKMRPLPHSVPGPDNDLNEKLDAYVQRAIGDEQAILYAFGQRWGPEHNKADKYFGFRPGNGVHDIHMNQGNVGSFRDDDGVWQDGGLLIHYPAIEDNGVLVFPEQWVGVFLAFQSQCWHTDDVHGHCIGAAPQPPEQPPAEPSGEVRDGHVRIVAALVNPAGDDPGKESVTLINVTPDPIDLTGWAIADRNKKKSLLAGPVLEGGQVTTVRLDGRGAQLGNDGGLITLLDPQGLKIDGVSYTKQQAGAQGWTLVFPR